MNNQIFLFSLDSIKIMLIQLLFFEKLHFPQVRWRAVPRMVMRARKWSYKRVKVKNKKPRGSSPSAISLSPVLPSLDSTDWRGTACSLSTSRPQHFLFSPFFLRVECSRVLKFKPKKLLHVCHFAAGNQCSRRDLLKNMMVKLRSMFNVR